MKTFSKVLSMFLVVVMCFGLFAASAFADFDFDNGSNGGFTASESFAAGGTFDFDGGYSAAVSESFEAPAAPAAQADTFTLNEDQAQEEAKEAAAAEVTNKAEDGTFKFDGLTEADTFNTPYNPDLPTKFSDPNPKDISKDMTDAAATVTITMTSGGTFEGDTFPAGLAYSTSATGSNLISMSQGTHYNLSNANQLQIKGSWLKTLNPGTYYFYGKRSEDVPVKIGFVNINSGGWPPMVTAKNSPYVKPSSYDSPYSVAAIEATYSRLKDMSSFGVAAITSSYTRVLGVNDYTVSGNKITLDQRYLNGLEDGEYYLIGFPTEGSTGDQVKICKFIVKSGKTGGTYSLTPDYQMWYGGTDPLTFYSEIHDIAGKDWNYKGYEWDVTVPDIIVSTRSSMAGATSVRIDQYWDLGYGYIMLGTNFLNSLNPEETYYMQVIDARAPDLVRSNVVSFRVGPTLRAIDTDKHVINSTRSLRFRSSSPVSEVYVGNIPLTDAADYGVSWDGKTVTLSFEFLNKRTPGNTYTIKVRTTDGNYASTTFQVLTTAQGSASPRTGDESNLGLWAAFLLLSGTAVVVLVPKLRKHDI